MVKLHYIDNFNEICTEGFNLYLGMLKNEYNFNLVGILRKNNKIIEYCETINIPDYCRALEIYDKIRDNNVFPNHFYCVIDDN